MKKIYEAKFLSSILAMILIVSSLIVPAIPSYADTDMNLVFTAFENYVKAAENTATPDGLLAAVRTVISTAKLDKEKDIFIKHAVPGVKDDDTESGYQINIPGSDGAVAAIFDIGGKRVGFAAAFPHTNETIHIKSYAIAGVSEGFTYETDTNGIQYITAYTGTADKIIFPDNKLVTMAEKSKQTTPGAFDNVKAVYIATPTPENWGWDANKWVKLQNAAFSGWKNLTAVQFNTLHDGMLFDHIKYGSTNGMIPDIFKGCPNLKYVRLPEETNAGSWLFAIPSGLFTNCSLLENVNMPRNKQACFGIAADAFEGTAVRDIFCKENTSVNREWFKNPYFSGGIGNVYNYDEDMTFCRAAALITASCNNILKDMEADENTAAQNLLKAVDGAHNAESLRTSLSVNWNGTYYDNSGKSELSVSFNGDTIPVPVTFKVDTLGALSVEGFNLKPAFDPDILEYCAAIPGGTESLKIIAEAAEGASVGEIKGNGGFKYGVKNTVEIPVTSTMGSVVTYHIYVTVIDPDELSQKIISQAEKYVEKNKNDVTPAGLLAAVKEINADVTLDAEKDFFIKHAVPGVKDDDTKSGYPLNIPGSDGAVAAVFKVGETSVGFTAAFPHETETIHIGSYAIAGDDRFADDFTYEKTDAKYPNVECVTDYTGSADKLIFPKDAAVTMAAKDKQKNPAAFKNVKAVYIDTDYPSNWDETKYVKMQNSAFSGWQNLKAVQFGEHANNTILSDWQTYDNGLIPNIFAECPNLKYAKLPDKMNVADWLYALPTGIFSGCAKLENANLPDNDQGCYGIAYNAFEGTAVRDIFACSNAEINMDYFIKPAFKTGVGNVYNYAYDMMFCRAAALAAAMANQIEYSNDMSSEEVMDKIKSAVTGSANASELKDKLIFGWNNSYTDKADMVNGTLTISNADGTFVPVSFTRNKDQGLTALHVGYELSPEFNTDIYEYSVSVPNSVTALGIAAKTVPGAVVEKITGNSDFKAEKEKKITITVKTISGNTVKYVLKVTRSKPILFEDVPELLMKAASKFSAVNSTMQSELALYLEKSIEGSGVTLALKDFYMYDAVSGAHDNYGVLVPGYKGYITAVAEISQNNKTVKTGIKVIVNPDIAKYEFTEDEVSKPEDFNISPDGKTLWWYSGTAKKIVIPAGIEYMDTGWNGADEPEKAVALILPDSLKELPGMLCYGMRRLEVVYMGDLIRDIPNSTFNKCFFLKHIRLSDNIENITGYSFFCTPSLAQLHIPFKVEKIEPYAFCGTLLRDITLPAALNTIEGLFIYAYPTTRAVSMSDGGLFGTTELRADEVDEVQEVIDSVRFKKIYRNVTILGENTEMNSTSAFSVSWENADAWAPAAPMKIYAKQGSAAAEGFEFLGFGTDGKTSYYEPDSLTVNLALNMKLTEAAARAQYTADNLYITDDTSADDIDAMLKNSYVSENVSSAVWEKELSITKSTAAAPGRAGGTLRISDNSGAYFDIVINKPVYEPLPERIDDDDTIDIDNPPDEDDAYQYPMYLSTVSNTVFLDIYNYKIKIEKSITISELLSHISFLDQFYLTFFDEYGNQIPQSEYSTYMLTSRNTASLYNKWGELYDSFSIEVYSESGIINTDNFYPGSDGNSTLLTRRAKKITTLKRWVPSEFKWWIAVVIAGGVLLLAGAGTIIFITIRKRRGKRSE